MKRNFKTNSRIAGLMVLLTTLASCVLAQTGTVNGEPSSPGMWPYLIIFIVLASIGVAHYYWKKSRESIERASYDREQRNSDYFRNDGYEGGDVDAEKELEWLRKAKKSKNPKKVKAEQAAEGEELWRGASRPVVNQEAAETRAYQEKMRMLQYAQLPINSFGDLFPSKRFEPLAESNAKALLDAIDQANEEVEPDEFVRDLSVKVLAAFRTSNSVEALSQMALYDLSSGLRSKAVTVLADFDHESVFETILLACADPTREVRAAAARGLFRLNFDRSGAWKRIIETNDEYRMSQAARAAIEAGIAAKSFERLVHEDLKVAYEAFTLVALMMRAGEHDEILEALHSHKDERVKMALLHVIKAMKDERTLGRLDQLLQSGSLSPNVLTKLQDVIDYLKGATARMYTGASILDQVDARVNT
jgi:hypothetical protein